MLANQNLFLTYEAQCVIDGQRINIDTMDSAVEAAIDYAQHGIGFTFFTLNLDHLCKRRRSQTFRDCYGRATFVCADGAPIVWLARSVGVELARTTGADMVTPIAAAAAKAGISIFLFGTSEEVLALTAQRLTEQHPGLVIAGMEAPPMGFDPTSEAAQAAADRIVASGAGFCFVALGAPKQEIFADMVLARTGKIGLFCIGAALDFIAGRQRRAPEFMSRNGFEWLWRLALDPRRLMRRYVDSAVLLAGVLMPWRFPQLVARGSTWPPPPPPTVGAPRMKPGASPTMQMVDPTLTSLINTGPRATRFQKN